MRTQSKNISLSEHVGHMVSGTIPQKSKENDNPDDTSPQNHLVVTKLGMISDSCKKIVMDAFPCKLEFAFIELDVDPGCGVYSCLHRVSIRFLRNRRIK